MVRNREIQFLVRGQYGGCEIRLHIRGSENNHGHKYRIQQVNLSLNKCVKRFFFKFAIFLLISRDRSIRYTVNSTIHLVEPSIPNKLIETNRVSFASIPLVSKDFDFSVWSTDYDTYAIIYSCHQLIPMILKADSLWIVGREKHLDPKLLEDLKEFVQARGINLSNLEHVVQT
jgi:hypothetical protein